MPPTDRASAARKATVALAGAPTVVLGLLCAMYFITYVDRVNIATAATAIKSEFAISNTQLGFALGAFGYAYALFQIVGGFIGDRVGARRTLAACGVVWAAATAATGLVGGLISLLVVRFILGLGEGATFPTATRAMSNWLPREKRGFAQGITHTFARAGNAVTPPIVAGLMTLMGWRAAFVCLGVLSVTWTIVWFSYFRDDPRRHKAIAEADLVGLPPYRGGGAGEALRIPWARLVMRMLPTTFVYFCYAWTLWLYLTWLPSFFQQGYGLKLGNTAFFSFGVLLAGMIGDTVGGVLSDHLLRRSGSFLLARRNLIVGSLLASLVFLIPVLLFKDLIVIALSLSAAFFCLEITIGPIWSVPMDIAPKYSGTAAGIMNTGSAVAGFASPVVFGWLVDLTGDWHLPFAGSIGLLLLGAVLAFFMHPERQIAETAPAR
ncbi:MAG TPA: MFS transporter [Xanthobacteraceae bacterium]|nr:MFS transporter [Xanthobacteraceae bacterium]